MSDPRRTSADIWFNLLISQMRKLAVSTLEMKEMRQEQLLQLFSQDPHLKLKPSDGKLTAFKLENMSVFE